jgi:NAD(P)-dependent dehydrogenase (short-subunit alcohol dehydrogenase family)
MPSALVVGGGRRIGAGIVRGFARRGYDVGFTYRQSADRVDELIGYCQSLGVQCHAAFADLTDEHQSRNAYDTLADQLGALPDVVISNAGVFPDPVTVEELTPETVRWAIDVNLIPITVLASWYSKQQVSGANKRRLIAITSLGATEVWKDRLAYNASKAALAMAVKSLARSLAPGISVNSVAPGAIMFPEETTTADTAVSSVDRIPMQRYGSIDDIFDAVWFFATSSTYITGQVIAVDGGYGLVR